MVAYSYWICVCGMTECDQYVFGLYVVYQVYIILCMLCACCV